MNPIITEFREKFVHPVASLDNYKDELEQWLLTKLTEVEKKGKEDAVEYIKNHGVPLIGEINRDNRPYSELLASAVSYSVSLELLQEAKS